MAKLAKIYPWRNFPLYGMYMYVHLYVYPYVWNINLALKLSDVQSFWLINSFFVQELQWPIGSFHIIRTVILQKSACPQAEGCVSSAILSW